MFSKSSVEIVRSLVLQLLALLVVHVRNVGSDILQYVKTRGTLLETLHFGGSRVQSAVLILALARKESDDRIVASSAATYIDGNRSWNRMKLGAFSRTSGRDGSFNS